MAAKISGISIAKLDANERVIPKNSKLRVAWWRVTLGKKITGAKKLRKYFATEGAAKVFISEKLEGREKEGNDTFALSPALRVEAEKCQELLDEAAEKAGRRLSLSEAVGYYLRHALPQGGTSLFEDAAKAFVANRKAKNLKARYITNLESQFKKLNTEYMGKKVNLITAPMIEAWLAKQKWSPKTRNNYLVTLRTFFGYCVRQKWCAENPAEALEKSVSDDAVTGILTTTEAARILEAAKACPDALPVIAIQLFAGLRRSEACALDWSELQGSMVEVTAAKSKTRSRRVVDIQPVLEAWLGKLRKVKGRIFEYGEDHYNTLLREVVDAANTVGKKQQPPWDEINRSHNCLRHTCASMHLAHFTNDSYTALQMGHSTAILHKHYKGLVNSTAAASFWKLTPEVVEGSEPQVAGIEGAA